jgi:hypothetical protein
VAAKTTSVGAMMAGKVVGVVTQAVQVALEGPGMARAVAAVSEFRMHTKREILTRIPVEPLPTCLPPRSSVSSASTKSSADSYTSWSESELLNTGESEA